MRSPSLSAFLLKKWYLDCVDESGNTAIAYAAMLKWRGVSLQYTSLITQFGGTARLESSIRQFKPPTSEGSTTEIDLPHLRLRGRWSSLSASQQHTIFKDGKGSVEWHCIHPKAACQLCLADGQKISGLGYVECLTLSVPPWELPLEELHWGRFLASDDYVVWLDWRGPYQKRLVLRNGVDQTIQTLGETRVVFANGDELDLDQQMTLRQGRLGKTVFSALAPLRKTLPGNMLAVHEQKWLSHGKLVCDGRARFGWAIHEVVKWKA